LKVKRHEELVLGRGGPHFLLSDLAKQLAAYDSFPMTLNFERAGNVVIEVLVEEESSGGHAGH
jgi:copper(I)-binding protein